MRKVLAAGAIGVALFAGMAAPEVASAATSHAAASSQPKLSLGGRCEYGGAVRINTSAVYAYYSNDTASAHYGVAYRGEYYGCAPIVTGAAYRLCGATRPANGYIPVDYDGDGYLDSFIPSTCVTDA